MSWIVVYAHAKIDGFNWCMCWEFHLVAFTRFCEVIILVNSPKL